MATDVPDTNAKLLAKAKQNIDGIGIWKECGLDRPLNKEQHFTTVAETHRKKCIRLTGALSNIKTQEMIQIKNDAHGK